MKITTIIIVFMGVGLVIVIFNARFIGQNGIKFLVILNLCIVTFLAWIGTFISITTQISTSLNFGGWLNIYLLHGNWEFCFDSLSLGMISIILSISIIVHIYSCDYIKNDPHIIRFLIYLSLFTITMMILVTANNFLVFFVGWESVGICSYLLINFWSTRVQANKSALKALFINRIGDVCLLLAISLVFITFQTIEFNLISNLTPYFLLHQTIVLKTNYQTISIISGLLLIGAIGKSAQIGLHIWLPDAMEGPTPVSALLHAATMVTAGIFLILKCSFFFEVLPALQMFISVLGLFTALMMALIACVQNDIKKIIAYSTCSQLGYMFFAAGLSQYNLAFFHLFNHAFFKALLFLSAGIIIHSYGNEQDIRRFGKSNNIFLSVYIINIIGTLAIVGFPFVSGFYSKDLIVECSYVIFQFTNFAFYWLNILIVLLTAFYSFKIVYFVFYGDMRLLNKSKFIQIHVIPNFMFLPLCILGFVSCFFGFIFRELFIGVGENNFNFTNLPHTSIICFETEFLPFYIKILPFLCSCFSVFILYIFINYFPLLYIQINTIQNFIFIVIVKLIKISFYKFYYDIFFNSISQIILQFGYKVTFKFFDKYLIEGLVVIINFQILQLGKFFNECQTGLLVHYIGQFVLGFIFFFTILL
jgi:proton-translocating NADH-quinone oxidoreductase chain L